MTSTPVNNAKSVFMDFVGRTPETNPSTGETGSFNDVLSKQTGGNETEPQTEQSVDKAPETKLQTKAKQSAVDRVKQEEPPKAEDDISAEISEIVGALQQKAEEIIGQIAEELGVTVEDVLNAMETLGLTAMDLFQPENLTAVVMATSGETDMLSLLTNDDLCTSLKNLKQFAANGLEEVKTVYQIPKEELQQVMEQAKETVETNVEADVMPEKVVEGETLPEEKHPQIVVEYDETQNVKATQTGEEADDMMPIQNDNTLKVNMEEEITQGGKQFASDTDKGDAQGHQNLFLQNLKDAVNAAVTKDVNVTGFEQPQVREIMDQVLEFMKIQVKPQMSQIEMQLHPESLGTLNVHLSVKEGIVTAQFTAQNDTVKAILESQMVQLKETFAEQGVKVEAVEVSVQANGFRQEYENSKGGENPTEEDKKKQVRRINLNNLSALEEEELSEEEQLAVSMMEANGSTVDYTA